MKQTWEYRVVIPPVPYTATPTQNAELVERALNQYGAEGWELVLVEPQHNTLFLKRPK